MKVPKLQAMHKGRKWTLIVTILVTLALSACSITSSKKGYVLAEKLWNDGKYAASVAEFEKVYSRDPHGQLGQQALYRAAMTQAYFLSQYAEAIRKLKIYAEENWEKPVAKDAQNLIGELLYSKLQQYDIAIQHYQLLLQQSPRPEDVPEFHFRIAKSYFYLMQFDEAVKQFKQLVRLFPKSEWAEKAAFEIGTTLYTRGEQGTRTNAAEAYQEAIDAFRDFQKKYPSSKLGPEAQFGIAASLEEQDQIDAAYHLYESLKSTYPSPKVIEIKLARIRERKTQRSR